MQDEDYDDIRRYRRHAVILEGIENAKEKYAYNSNDEFFAISSKKHHIQKRNYGNVFRPVQLQQSQGTFSKFAVMFKDEVPQVSCYPKIEEETGPVTGYGVPNTRYEVPNTGYGVPNTGYGVPKKSKVNWYCVLGPIIKMINCGPTDQGCSKPSK